MLRELQADGDQGGAIIGQQRPGDPSRAVCRKSRGPQLQRVGSVGSPRGGNISGAGNC